MNITIEWLKENNACQEGTSWFLSQKETELSKVVRSLIKHKKFNWANWTLSKIMTHHQNVLYACYAAKQSLHYFEKRFPQDKRPRKAIQAALKWARNPSELNKVSAAESAELAWSAAESAESAAAWSAAWSAASAARSAESAASAASAAWSAARSEASAWSAAWKKILKYGLKLCK